MKIHQLSNEAAKDEQISTASLLSLPDIHLYFRDHTLIDNHSLEKIIPIISESTCFAISQYLLNKPLKAAALTAKFYQKQLSAKNSSAIVKEIILCALFLGLSNTLLEEQLDLIYQNRLGVFCSIKTISSKFQPHLRARCMTLAGEFNLDGQDLVTRLNQLIESLNFCAHHNECPIACLTEINHLAKQMSLTALDDLLPPQVSQYQKLENLMSDHLPQLHRFNGTNILTWNILTKNYFIGFADSSGLKSVIETNNGYKKRLENIANYLVKISDIFKINVILLQEAYEDLCKYLPASFKKKWAILVDNHWKMILYKKQIWSADEHTGLKDKLKNTFAKSAIKTVVATDFQTLVLTHKKNQKTIALYNTYTQHEDEPDNLEQAINAIFALHKNDSALANIASTYIAGDFNRRLPDCGIYAKDNATHLVPPMFRAVTTPHKLYDYTDCCFELNQGHIRQTNGMLLDTLQPEKIFVRPLVSLQHALQDRQYTRVIFPLSHKVRIVNKENSHYGQITLEEFKMRLEHQIQQPILQLQASKNRYGVLYLHIHCEHFIPLLDNLGVPHKDSAYHFIILPQTSDSIVQQKATKQQFSSLREVPIINAFGAIVHLIISAKSTKNQLPK